jgi:hypothetical protein
VDVRPGIVEQGEVTALRIELPQLRPGPAPERLEVAGDGLDVLSTRLDELAGAETRWTVRLRATTPPGRLPVALRAVFADGAAVEVDSALTVVPAPEQAPFPVAAAIAGVGLAAGVAFAALFLARRKS